LWARIRFCRSNGMPRERGQAITHRQTREDTGKGKRREKHLKFERRQTEKSEKSAAVHYARHGIGHENKR